MLWRRPALCAESCCVYGTADYEVPWSSSIPLSTSHGLRMFCATSTADTANQNSATAASRALPWHRSPLSLLPCSCTWRHLRGVNTHGMRTWRDGRGTSGQKRKSNEDFNLHWSKKRWCCVHAGGLSQVSPLPCLSGWGGLGAFPGNQGERTGHGGLIYFLLIFIGLLTQELITKTNESPC